MSLGERIRQLRKKRGFTQPDIAEKLDMGRSNFGHIENDRVVPSSATLQKIADILNTSTDYLLGRTDTPEGLAGMSKEDLDINLDNIIHELSQGPFKIKYITSDVKQVVRDWIEHCNINELRDVEDILKIFAMILAQFDGRISDEHLIQSGIKGLTTAYNTFDSSKGVRFTTYASRCIENQILMDAPERYSNEGLTDKEILTLAAHRIGYEGNLSEEELDKIRLALKIALSKD